MHPFADLYNLPLNQPTVWFCMTKLLSNTNKMRMKERGIMLEESAFFDIYMQSTSMYLEEKTPKKTYQITLLL